MGDFNIDLLKTSPLATKWNELYSNFGLDQIITQPTRVTETTQTLIDHIYATEDVKILHQSVINYNISDHSPVLVKLDMKNNHRSKSVLIKYRNSKKFNQTALQTDLQNAVWPDCNNLDVDEAV